MNELSIHYIEFDPDYFGSLLYDCVRKEEETIRVLDIYGDIDTRYRYQYKLPSDDGSQYLCTWSSSLFVYGYFFLRRQNLVDYIVGTHNYVVWSFIRPTYVISLSFREIRPTLIHDSLISNKGELDIAFLAGYTPSQLGGWFGSLEVVSFNQSIITSDYVANPSRYNFGEISLNYHGFVTNSFVFGFQKLFIDLHQFFATLEPEGIPEPLSTWVQLPPYPRASGLSWGLLPGVIARLKIWSEVLVQGFGPYF